MAGPPGKKLSAAGMGMSSGLPTLPPLSDDPTTESEENKNNNINIVDPSDENPTSGTNIIQGFKDYYDYVDKLGFLDELKINETKENLLNIAEENKNNNEENKNNGSESKEDSNLISAKVEGINPLQNIFNYNPSGELDLSTQFGNFNVDAGVTGSLREGINPNYNIGFNTDNFNLNYGDTGFTGNFNRELGENTNINVDAKDGEINPSFDTSFLGTDFKLDKNQANLARNFLNDRVNVQLAQNFDGNTDITGTYTGDEGLTATVNPREFLLNKTFQVGGGDLKLGGQVGMNGDTTGQIDYERELGPGKLNVYVNPNDYGFGYNFFDRKF
tara:strand:- start:284 stop:1273 length:990 start_codon:yes stop_codon:yes gene_type:complete